VDSEASLKGALTRISSTATTVAQGGNADPHAGHAMPKEAPAVASHKAEGVVRAVGNEVLIKHGAIPSAGMGAMTMAFKAPKGGVPANIKEGTPVAFTFVFTPEGEMQLTSIVPATPPTGKR
jgi:Cu(I)/Ag(I) efflux system membrane fusion protein